MLALRDGVYIGLDSVSGTRVKLICSGGIAPIKHFDWTRGISRLMMKIVKAPGLLAVCITVLVINITEPTVWH